MWRNFRKRIFIHGSIPTTLIPRSRKKSKKNSKSPLKYSLNVSSSQLCMMRSVRPWKIVALSGIAKVQPIKGSNQRQYCWPYSLIRNYEVIDENDCPKIVKDCLSFLTSEALFLILSQLTGLSLHKKDACHSQNKGRLLMQRISCKIFLPDPCSSSAIRQWKHGCYTLVYDDAPKLCDYILDGIMYFNCDSWDVKMGGLTSYISEGEDEEVKL